MPIFTPDCCNSYSDYTGYMGKEVAVSRSSYTPDQQAYPGMVGHRFGA